MHATSRAKLQGEQRHDAQPSDGPEGRGSECGDRSGRGLRGGIPLAGADQTDFGTPGTSEFAVPEGVCSVQVSANGAQGGDGVARAGGPGGSPGAAGGQVTATIAVTPGERLGINVGGQGADGTTSGNAAGGVNGGGAGGASESGGGGGGGGASDVRQAAGGSGCLPECTTQTTPDRAGTELADRQVVAGGGGGAAATTTAPTRPRAARAARVGASAAARPKVTARPASTMRPGRRR